MNIGIVTTWFPAGGGYVSKAYQEVLEKNHTVFIFARGGQMMHGDLNWDLPNVTWASKHYNDIKTSELIKWAKNSNIDIIFFNEQRYWRPVIEAKKAGFCIGAYIDYYTQKTVPAFEIYDFLICNTKRHYSVFNWHPSAHYVPWGTDIEKFRPSENKIDRKLTYLMNLGWEGKYTYDRKGLLLGIDAFKDVIGNCQLLIYSQVEFLDCLLTWREKILSDSRIKFIYGTFDPFPYNTADVYLYPSRLDGIGLSLPEALSCGLPVITTDSSPMNEFVDTGVNGYLIDVEKYLGRHDGYYWAESICNVGSLKKAMQSYIDDREIIISHRINARELAILHLDWKNNANKLSEIFNNSLSNRKKLDIDIINYALMLDRAMAPSFTYRFLSIIRDFIKYYFKFLKI